MKLSNNDKYYIAEFLYAGECDTMIKSEVEKVVKILHQHKLITDQTNDSLLAYFKHEEISVFPDDPEKFTDAHLNKVVDAISVSRDDALVLGVRTVLYESIGKVILDAILDGYCSGMIQYRK